MKASVLSCSECGGSLKVSQGQFISKCNYCGTSFYIPQGFAPAILIKQSVDLNSAKSVVLKNLRNRAVSREFLKNSFFEKGTLFFVPFVELRGIKSKIIRAPGSEKEVFSYIAYEYMERGSELSELSIDFIDLGRIEETLLNAEQDEFNLVEMRKAGVVLPVSENILDRKGGEKQNPEIIELHYRIIYLPVWEIKYTFRGIVFHSYISAVDGSVIEIKAMKDHKKKLLFSIAGIGLIGLLFAKLISNGMVYYYASKMGNRIASFLLLWILGGIIFAFFIFFLLFPYFWEMYAFREFVIIKNGEIESETINFEDNFFTKLLKKITSAAGKIFENIKITIEDDRNKN